MACFYFVFNILWRQPPSFWLMSRQKFHILKEKKNKQMFCFERLCGILETYKIANCLFTKLWKFFAHIVATKCLSIIRNFIVFRHKPVDCVNCATDQPTDGQMDGWRGVQTDGKTWYMEWQRERQINSWTLRGKTAETDCMVETDDAKDTMEKKTDSDRNIQTEGKTAKQREIGFCNLVNLIYLGNSFCLSWLLIQQILQINSQSTWTWVKPRASLRRKYGEGEGEE